MLTAVKAFFFQKTEEQFSYAKLCLGILLLLICGIRLLRNFNQLVDISFDDEVKYMRYGLDMFAQIKNDWGPTYNMWYKLLSVFEHRPIELYLLNYKIIILLTASTLFAFLYSYGISFIASMWMALCMLVSNVNIVNYPRISAFVVALFLWCLIINKLFITSKSKQYILICFVLFVAAFARPELMLSFFLFLIFTMYYIYQSKTFKATLVFSIPFIIIIWMLLDIVQLPANTYMGKDRIYGVFCQHYTLKYIYQNKLDYALFIDWIAFSKKQFPNCNTFLDIVKNHPLTVITGILTNAKIFLLVVLASLSEFLYPKFLFYRKYLEILSVVLLIILPLFALIPKQKRQFFWSRVTPERELLLILLVFALPGLVSAFVFFPRPHYLLFLLIPLLYMLSIVLEILFDIKHIRTVWVFVLVGIFFWRMPDMQSYKTPRIISGPCPNQSYKTLIKMLNERNQHQHVIFSNILNLSMMADKNYTDFSAEQDYNNEQTFIEQLKARKVDNVLVTDFLLQDLRLKNDSTWQHFIQYPNKYGFVKKMPFKDCSTYLLYKE
ncbi:MAG: hypothetical protein IT275_06850 [Chitinophagales bacterium]|nr:hypothetical protein [Chitinophagales bacterium]